MLCVGERIGRLLVHSGRRPELHAVPEPVSGKSVLLPGAAVLLRCGQHVRSARCARRFRLHRALRLLQLTAT